MDDDFKTITGYHSYVNKPEITNIGPGYLVKGSKNCVIDYALRVVSRAGYTLYAQANDGGNGIVSSYDWDTSNDTFYQMRSHDGKLEFDFGAHYYLLKGGFATSKMQFAKIWDDTEKIDMLMMVCGDTNVYKWSGGVAKISSATATTVTKQGVITAQTTIAFVAGTPGMIAPTITDSANNFLNAGFAAGDTLYVTGSTGNSRNFTVGSVTAGTITLIMGNVLVSEAAGPSITMHNGSPTWATSRFIINGTRKITYRGVDYAYTGGETTDTLTGLTGFPLDSAQEDVVFQTLITLPNPSPAIPAYFKADLVAVQLNQLILGSTKSQEIYGSSITDYTNFTLTSPRAPGDPFMVTMDKTCTCIVPIDNVAQTTSSIMFGGGTNEFFQLSFQLSQDNTNELVRMIKLKTATGSGLISTDAISPVKTGTAYISHEPALDILSQVQNADRKDLPLSDPIKDDFDMYDFTNAQVKYWKRAIYIAIPAEGIFLIYDLMRNLWQPPQYAPISCFSVRSDDGWLYGHSSITDETYKMFDGLNDNGNIIPMVARFGYNNGGRRDRIKNMTEYWTDGYITQNGVLDMGQYLGFEGAKGIKNLVINGNDPDVTVASLDASPLGSEPLGAVPLGGVSFGLQTGLAGQSSEMVRYYQVDTMSLVDYFEQFVEYKMSTLDAQCAIVAHGSNQFDAGTAPISNKK